MDVVAAGASVVAVTLVLTPSVVLTGIVVLIAMVVGWGDVVVDDVVASLPQPPRTRSAITAVVNRFRDTMTFIAARWRAEPVVDR